MTARRGAGEQGFPTVQYVVAISFSLLALMWLVNLVAFQYGRGAVRAALDEGTRAGSRVSGSVAGCEDRANAALQDLLGGTLSDQTVITCVDTGATVRATATATFKGWLDPVPDWTFTVSAIAVKEHTP
jgi:hypothetical protein